MVMAIKQILSPLPGILYRRPTPDKPPYVSEGDSVSEDDVVALIEVMKSFHNVPAGLNGKLVKFLVEDEDAIMVGQPIADILIDDG